MRASTLCGNHRHLACFHGAFGRRLRRRVAVVSAAFDRLEVKTKKDEESQRGKMTSGVASAVHVGFLERPSLRVEERRSVLSEEWIEKGTVCITSAFIEYFLYKAKITSMLIEAVDVYLIGTVMLVFGVGLYELFISNLDIAKISTNRSSLFGRFMLKEKDVKLDGTLCSLPRTPAFGLGIAAITCLLVAQIVGMFALHRLLCCREKKGMLIMRITLLALSWVAFGFVVILLGTASSMNEGQAYGMGWLDGECYLVKHGIYVAAALLDVVTILCIFGLMYMARRAAPPPTLD